MNIHRFLFGASLIFPFFLQAATVRLMNDSQFLLTAVIYAADGTELGSTVVPPEQTSTWSDEEYSDDSSGDQFKHFGTPSLSEQDASYSQTPYTVIWSCPDGTQFSTCQDVATGATVTAQGCGGSHYCKKPKKNDQPGTSQNNE